MTEQELNEWIAQQLGWEQTGEGVWSRWIDKEQGLYEQSGPNPPSYVSFSFAEVKREIERRGWDWESVYESSPGEHGLHHLFLIGIPTKLGEDWSLLKTAHAETEELAGCLAFKAAIEATT